ncbi:hypothetical protein DPMN_140659 [Dreissena polymorpha]|uniref:Secreted protein n=1 Tax=Dreissena polymorpha TaxID=45954 RepID=A0A9D4GBY0_DREPO|nr:hypothetical protein DPMN_140659 [Dreissena polymorpha]
MDALCSVFTAMSLLPFGVSMGVSCSVFTAKSLLPFCVSMDALFSGCSRPSHYCLSVSAWIYCALGVNNQVITAFLCQHGCIVFWVFTTKSLLPFCVSIDVSRSGCSQPSHYRLCLSEWMYRALGIHNQVIIAFLCQ